MQDPKQQQWLLEPGGIATRLRELQGQVSGVIFADRVGMRPSKVSKLRLGQQLPTEEDIRLWVAAAGADATVADSILAALAEAPKNHSSFERRLKRGQTTRQRDYNELVKQSDTVKMFERSFIPRLLQTFDYARSVLQGSVTTHKIGADDVIAASHARLECQRFMYDGRHTFEFIIDETVLTREVGSPQIMQGQMDRLLSAIDLPNVRIGIIPIYGRPHDVLRNSFELYGQIGIVETYYNDDPQSTEACEKYEMVMRDLWPDAVEGAVAHGLIRKAAEHHTKQAQQHSTPRKA